MTDRSSSPGSPMGKLTVDLASDSQFLERTLPVEVRDSNLRIVARDIGTGQVDLPIGLYEVSAILGDGRRHSALVDVREGPATPVTFGQARAAEAGAESPAPTEPPAAASVAAASVAAPSSISSMRPRLTREMAARPVPAGEEAGVIDVIEVDGADVVERGPGRVSFQCAPEIHAVPSALIEVAGRRQWVSLPISPREWTPSGSCILVVERTSAGVHGQAWISPERTVANGLQNMLSAGYVLEAARVAGNARELLQEKYQDPTGAALGALLLYKVGLLGRWEGWVRNLAHSFSWLPDGKVLLAQIHADDGSPSQADLDLAIAASRQRILYAETYSLLLDLLRRWPQGTTGPEHRGAIESLATRAPYLDRESICLSEWLPSERD